MTLSTADDAKYTKVIAQLATTGERLDDAAATVRQMAVFAGGWREARHLTVAIEALSDRHAGILEHQGVLFRRLAQILRHVKDSLQDADTKGASSIDDQVDTWLKLSARYDDEDTSTIETGGDQGTTDAGIIYDFDIAREVFKDNGVPLDETPLEDHGTTTTTTGDGTLPAKPEDDEFDASDDDGSASTDSEPS